MKGKLLLKSILLAFMALYIVGCELEKENSYSLEGDWICKEDHSELGLSTYSISIEVDATDSTKIRIYNFLNLGNSINSNLFVRATLSGRSINIPKQKVEKHEVTGNGTVSASFNSIDLNYTDDDGVKGSTVSAKYTRQ